MKSIAFPDFLNNTTTKIIEDHEATLSNYKLLLQSSKGSLFGDPYFGTNLQKRLFEPNNIVLKDKLIDDILVATQTFQPQLKLERKGITINQAHTDVAVNIKALNLLDYTLDTFNLTLMGDMGE